MSEVKLGLQIESDANILLPCSQIEIYITDILEEHLSTHTNVYIGTGSSCLMPSSEHADCPVMMYQQQFKKKLALVLLGARAVVVVGERIPMSVFHWPSKLGKRDKKVIKMYNLEK